MRVLLLLACTLGFACGDDDRPDSSRDASSDALSDAPSDARADVGDAASDATEDARDGGTPGCSTPMLDTDFVLADESETNIHPDAAFDGSNVWLTYTILEEGTRFFDVALRRIGCDGRAGDPIRVNTLDGESELDSTVAASAEGVLVGYQSDDRSGSSDALRPFVRAFELDGTPAGAAIQIASEREDEPLTATNWMTQVSTRPGGFWAAGAWGVESVSGFQIFLQELGADGSVAASANDVDPSALTQTAPNLGDGTNPWVAWVELGEGSDSSLIARRGDERVVVDPGTIVASNPSLSGDVLAYEAGGADQLDIFVRDLESGVEGSVGRLGDRDAAPAIAGDRDGFAVAWLRQTSGVRNDLFVAYGAIAEGEVTFGEPVQIPTSAPVFAYTPTLVEVSADTYFLAWSQGDSSPEFQVHGRFVQAP